MTRVVIAGAGGRMGQALVEAALGSDGMALAAALDLTGSAGIGRDAGERLGQTTGVLIAADVDVALVGSEVLIDFTRPEGTLRHLAACVRHEVGAVIGTTGFDESQKRTISTAAQRIPIVFAPNMSVGVNVLASLVEQAAAALGTDYDVEIVEMHHRHKVDAPSGTALQLGEAAARGLGQSLTDCAVYARHGATGERSRGSIGFAALRGGDVVGDHNVIFAGTGERIELSHRALSRQNFAAGAMRAARFVSTRRAAGVAGLFDMRDVLGLK
ncbi:MAG: 4-hydroxy-tetrahydrodipicolinate reductase [Casimicrobiaceae bacterium]